MRLETLGPMWLSGEANTTIFEEANIKGGVAKFSDSLLSFAEFFRVVVVWMTVALDMSNRSCSHEIKC